MITLCLLIILVIMALIIICTLSDLFLLTVAILALEKLFYRFKKRWDKKKKQKGAK